MYWLHTTNKISADIEIAQQVYCNMKNAAFLYRLENHYIIIRPSAH